MYCKYVFKQIASAPVLCENMTDYFQGKNMQTYLKISLVFMKATLSLTACTKSSCPAISLVTTENCCQLYLAKIESMAAT